MKEYIVFIDDTGTKELEDKATNFFSYCCIICKKENVNKIEKEINSFKSRYLKSDIELKSQWFRRAEYRKKYYLDPNLMTEETFNKISKELFQTMCKLPIHCLGAVLDKSKHELQYKYPHNPSATCYELLLQHIANYLTQYTGVLKKIVIDDMTGKTQCGNEWKRLLIDQHKELKNGHSPFYKNWTTRRGMNYSQIPESIEFKDSKTSILLQLTDLCAYNIMRQGKDYWMNFDCPPFYKGFEWIKSIMHCNPADGQIVRYGAICFP